MFGMGQKVSSHFDPCLLTNKIWLIFIGKKQKKNSRWLTQKKCKKVQKQAKNAIFVFLGCFSPYVGQPHSHIGWDKSMSFASINPTNPRTDPWYFHKNILRIGDFEKCTFFESAILIFFFKKKNFFLLHSHENQPKFIW